MSASQYQSGWSPIHSARRRIDFGLKLGGVVDLSLRGDGNISNGRVFFRIGTSWLPTA